MSAQLRREFWSARCATLLGAIFLYAAFGKILDPASFAEVIYHYKMGPHVGANLVAIALPWIELIVGLCLITGIWQRPAAMLTGAMLVFFIVMIAVAWIRPDVDVKDCGCFADGPPRAPWQVIVEDLFMLVLAYAAYFWARPEPIAVPVADGGAEEGEDA